jgi:hypothetical protein
LWGKERERERERDLVERLVGGPRTKMLAVFSGQVVEVPAELVAAGSRTPSPKTKASQLVGRFLAASEPAVSVQLGDHGHLAYSHTNQALLRPRYVRSCTGLHTALLLAGTAAP